MEEHKVIGIDILNDEGYRPARRWNQIINTINSDEDPDSITPPLGETEMTDYLRMKKSRDEENARIAKRCEEEGINPFTVGYDVVELEDE